MRSGPLNPLTLPGHDANKMGVAGVGYVPLGVHVADYQNRMGSVDYAACAFRLSQFAQASRAAPVVVSVSQRLAHSDR